MKITIQLIDGSIRQRVVNDPTTLQFCDPWEVIPSLFNQEVKNIAGYKLPGIPWEYRIKSVGLVSGYTGEYIKR